MKYKNESDQPQKVFIDGVTGPFRIVAPGESVNVRLDADQDVRVETVKTPDLRAEKPARKTRVKKD